MAATVSMRCMLAHRMVSVGFAALVTFGVGMAHSAPDSSSAGDPGRQRREFMNKGNAEYEQKHWEKAREYYLKSWEIKHHYTIAGNLADVEIKLGHYGDAAVYLKYVLANLPDNKPNERKAAEEQLLECKAHLTVVRVATDVTDATVLLDGHDVGQTPLREELLVEPGKHTIAVSKVGYSTKTIEFSAEGRQMDVPVTMKPTEATDAPTVTPTPAAPTGREAPSAALAVSEAPDTEPSNGYRVASVISFGVGAIGLAGGTIFYVKGQNSKSDATNQYNACQPHCSPTQKSSIADMDQTSVNQKTLGIAGAILGGVGVATGITLLLVEPKGTTHGKAAHVEPWLGAGQAGLRGEF